MFPVSSATSALPLILVSQIFPGLILSDIKPAKRMKFKTVCYLLVQLMHCRKMFKAEIPFSNVMTCEDDDKVRVQQAAHGSKKRVHPRQVCLCHEER